jgi:hypothetical protein
MIAEKLNARLRSNVVKNIFFVVGGVAPRPAAAEHPERSRPLETPPPDDPDEFLQTIQDPEIKQAFKKLLRSYRRSRRTGSSKIEDR